MTALNSSKSVSSNTIERLQAMLMDGTDTPVSLKTRRWVELQNNIAKKTTRLDVLESDRGDKTMANLVRKRIGEAIEEMNTIPLTIADLPARNARDIACKLAVATHAEPTTMEDAKKLFKLSASSQKDIEAFLTYASKNKRKRKTA